MTQQIFVAFASSDPFVAETIVNACEASRTHDLEFRPWNRNDVSGQAIDRSVFSWVESADSFVADISEPNPNVTYEIGLAIGMAKPVRFIRAANKDRKIIEEIGLLHNIGHNDYTNKGTLSYIFSTPPSVAPWPVRKRNREQPVYFLQHSVVDEFQSRIANNIKKIIKLKHRSFNPREIDRLTAQEAFDEVSQSFGVIAIWHNEQAPNHIRQNQRAAFATGIARGLDIPFILLASVDARLPLDLDEISTRWTNLADVDRIMREFRDQIYEAQEAFSETHTGVERFLDRVYCGDPAAENEAESLDSYFLETEQFRLTMGGELNIVLGRKGSGKTAIFLQVRDRMRTNRKNIIIDIHPEGFRLVKLKEFIVDQLSHGTRKEFIAAFWEYIIWLEIAHKLLENDKQKIKYDSKLLASYSRLEEAYKKRVEGVGDFSERLLGLTSRIVDRFQATQEANGGTITTSKILEIVYGSEISVLRQEVFTYLKLKGVVFFLFDNLDRFWTPTGFAEVDGLIIVGLVESLIDIRKRFSREALTFQWAIFLRSDVYEFVVKSMADYGKLAVASTEWNDKELLLKMFENRVLQGFEEAKVTWKEVWDTVSVPVVAGKPTLDFLIDASLMRPRYLIRLFETARRRAVTLGRDKIEEDDYKAAFEELGWQVLEDFDRELADVVPSAEQLIWDITQLGPITSLKDLRLAISKRVPEPEKIEAVVDVLIWTGCIGVRGPKGVTYISDCGFKRPFIRSLLGDQTARVIVFHPTLASIVTAAMPAGSDS